MEKIATNEPYIEADDREMQKEVYKNVLAELDLALKEKLNYDMGMPEDMNEMGFDEGFDFRGGTVAMQNFLQSLKFYEEAGKDLKGVISRVTFGPELGFDPSDKTLVLGNYSEAADIRSAIDALNPPDKVHALAPQPEPYEPETAYRAEFPIEAEENLTEKTANRANKGLEKFMSVAKEAWSLTPRIYRASLPILLATYAGVYGGQKAYEINHPTPTNYSDSGSTAGRKEVLPDQVKSSTFSKLKKWMRI
jgi:hypothetical protein